MSDFGIFLKDKQIGVLSANPSRNGMVYGFSYEKSYIDDDQSFNIDPSLNFSTGIQYPSDGLMFGFLSDVSPDRWGRALIKRKLGKDHITDLDALVEVSDFFRLGAVRIFDQQTNQFLGVNNDIPTTIKLNQLFIACNNLKNADADIQELFTPGSPMGGARPKASVIDQSTGDLIIAKFPKADDEHNVEAWENTMLTLARKSGINTVKANIHYGSASPHGILLIDRFDRKNNQQRVPYMSAMTALGYRDGSNDGSYVELLEFIDNNGDPKDGFELWKRMTFSMMVRNFDDHLRNHGFLRQNVQSTSP